MGYISNEEREKIAQPKNILNSIKDFAKNNTGSFVALCISAFPILVSMIKLFLQAFLFGYYSIYNVNIFKTSFLSGSDNAINSVLILIGFVGFYILINAMGYLNYKQHKFLKYFLSFIFCCFILIFVACIINNLFIMFTADFWINNWLNILILFFTVVMFSFAVHGFLIGYICINRKDKNKPISAKFKKITSIIGIPSYILIACIIVGFFIGYNQNSIKTTIINSTEYAVIYEDQNTYIVSPYRLDNNIITIYTFVQTPVKKINVTTKLHNEYKIKIESDFKNYNKAMQQTTR